MTISADPDRDWKNRISAQALRQIQELDLALDPNSFELWYTEAEVRGALDDAAPLYRDAPEARAARKAIDGTMAAFLREAAPQSSEAARVRAAELISRTIAALGKDFSSRPRAAAEIAAYADAVADMLCAYLKMLRRG